MELLVTFLPHHELGKAEIELNAKGILGKLLIHGDEEVLDGLFLFE